MEADRARPGDKPAPGAGAEEGRYAGEAPGDVHSVDDEAERDESLPSRKARRGKTCPATERPAPPTTSGERHRRAERRTIGPNPLRKLNVHRAHCTCLGGILRSRRHTRTKRNAQGVAVPRTHVGTSLPNT